MFNTLNTKSRRKYMAQIPSDELVTAQKDLTAKAFGLLMYYYSKGERWTWIDETMAKDLDMTVRKLREYRNELVKKKYILIVKGGITNVFIGRQAVLSWETPTEDMKQQAEAKQVSTKIETSIKPERQLGDPFLGSDDDTTDLSDY